MLESFSCQEVYFSKVNDYSWSCSFMYFFVWMGSCGFQCECIIVSQAIRYIYDFIIVGRSCIYIKMRVFYSFEIVNQYISDGKVIMGIDYSINKEWVCNIWIRRECKQCIVFIVFKYIIFSCRSDVCFGSVFVCINNMYSYMYYQRVIEFVLYVNIIVID